MAKIIIDKPKSKEHKLEDWMMTGVDWDEPKVSLPWNPVTKRYEPKDKKSVKKEESKYIKNTDIKAGKIYSFYGNLIYIKSLKIHSLSYGKAYEIGYQKLGKNLTPTKTIKDYIFYDDYSRLEQAVTEEKKKIKLKNLV